MRGARGRGAVRNYGTLYSLPIGLWFLVFFIAPLAIIAVFSFMQKGVYGGVELKLSFDAYAALFTPGMGKVLLNTVIVTVASTVLIVLIALPCGYYMARSRNKTFLLILVIIPFWTNFIIRVFAWITILGSEGVLNDLLRSVGLPPQQFMYNHLAIIIITVYAYLPYAILPLYSTIEKFDFSLLEAARDLGATKPQSMLKVLIPNVKSGIVTAVLFTFVPIFGSFAIAGLVGGEDTYMLGNYISDKLLKQRDWPFASSASMVIMLVANLGIFLLMAVNKKPQRRAVADSAADQGIQGKGAA